MRSIDIHSKVALAPGVRLQMDSTSGDPVLLYPEGVTVLNPTAHDIVTRCDGATSLDTIITALEIEYDAPRNELAEGVLECVRELETRKLIVLA